MKNRELVSDIFEPLESQNRDKNKQIQIFLNNSEFYLFTSVKNFNGVFSSFKEAKKNYIFSIQKKQDQQNKEIEEDIAELSGGFWKKNGDYYFF